jgi:glutathione S-transferase
LDQPTYRQDYIAGNEYSLADLLLTTIMVRIESVGTLDTYLAKLPLLGLWYARMQARPSFNLAFQRRQKMLATLGLIPAIAASFSIK